MSDLSAQNPMISPNAQTNSYANVKMHNFHTNYHNNRLIGNFSNNTMSDGSADISPIEDKGISDTNTAIPTGYLYGGDLNYRKYSL